MVHARARNTRPLRGPQAALGFVVLAVAYWGSVAFLVDLRTEVVALDAELSAPIEDVEELEEAPLDRQPLEPVLPNAFPQAYPRALGLAYGTPPMILTDTESRPARPQREAP